MEEQRFDIVFAGATLPGFDRDTVARNLVQIFRTTPETVARLLDGGTHVLKRGLDDAAAQKYRNALEQAGAAVEITAVTAAVVAPTPEYGFTLAPAGTDLLAPHERRQVSAIAPDTSGLSLAEAGVRLAPEAPPAPPPPDTSHITLAAPETLPPA